MTVAVLRHVPDNPLGHFEDTLTHHGKALKIIDVPETDGLELPAVESLEGLLILGGHMSVRNAEKLPYMMRELDFIRQAVEQDIPTFGICLGSQLISKAMGGTVSLSPIKEVGWTPIELTEEGKADPVISALAGNTPQFQWHEDTYTLPAGAVRLASTVSCAEQAFRMNQNIYAVQFHPEVTTATIEEWLGKSKNLSSEEKNKIWEETQTHYQSRKQRSADMFEAFCIHAW